MRSHGWLTLCFLATSLTPLAADDAVVGDYGAPGHLVIEGAKAFSAGEILQALSTNLDVAHASSPAAPLERLKAVLVEKVVQGYLQEGFADARANARQDQERLVLAVVEGPRFTAGEIRVDGITDISTTDLQSQWPSGEPAGLHAMKQEQLNARLESLFQRHGYYRAQFSVERALNRDRQTADLIVKVVDLGKPVRAEDMEISGDNRVTREIMFDFLALEARTVLTKDVQERFEQNLTNSGRFLSVDLQPVVPDDAAQPVHLRVALVPYEKAPPLNEPLSREQAALVKFANWATSFDEGADDFAIKVKWGAIEGEVVGSPRFGMLGWVRGLPHRGSTRLQPPPAFDLAIVESENEVGVYSFQRQRRLTAIPAPARFLAAMNVVIADGPPNLDGHGKLVFGIGLKNYSKKERRHCRFKFKQTAVGALSLAYQEEVAFAWKDDLLTVTRDDMRYVIDARTGRLVEHGNVESKGGVSVRMVADHDEFNEQLEAILAAARELPNDADGERPLSCVAQYAAQELEFWGATPEATKLAHVVRRIIARGALKRIDEWLASTATDDEAHFAIPDDLPSFENLRSAAEISPIVARLWGVEIADRLAPRHSWLWALWRESLFLAAKLPCRLDRPVEYLEASHAGPIQCWVAATLLDTIGHAAESRACAKAGLKLLSTESLRGEYESLLVEGYWSGDFPLHVAELVRQLSDQDVATLAAGIQLCGYGDESTVQAIGKTAGVLRETSDEPLAERTLHALDVLWRGCARQGLEASLTELAAEPVNMEELQKFLKSSFGHEANAP